MNTNLDDNQILQNTRERTPCILVLDISGSMQRPAGDTQQRRIDELNKGLQALLHSLLSDEEAVKRVEIAIVTVGGPNNAATLTQNFATVDSFSVPTFTAVGATPLGAGVQQALDALEARVRLLHRYGRSVTRPWMFVLSDGEPTDAESDWKLASRRSREAEHKGSCLIYPLLIEGVENQKLRDLSVNGHYDLNTTQFVQFFVWVSHAISRPMRTEGDAGAVQQQLAAAVTTGPDFSLDLLQ